MAKQINTRIQLKYDSWAGWSATNEDNKGANLVLKAGEVGICQISAETNADQSTSEPVVLFKVGDGTSIFSALPWVSAKAADVYGWAKQASLPIERATTETGGAGNAISTIKFEGGKIIYTTTTVTESRDFTEFVDRVDQSLATIENTMASEDELQEVVNMLSGQMTAVSNKFADYTATNELDGKITELGYAKTTAIPTKVSELNNDVPYLVAADIANKTDKTYVDGELAKKANLTDFEEVQTKVNNFFADDAGVADVIDTLNDIQNYIKNDTEGAADITSRIGALETKVDVEKVSTAISSGVQEATSSANGYTDQALGSFAEQLTTEVITPLGNMAQTAGEGGTWYHSNGSQIETQGLLALEADHKTLSTKVGTIEENVGKIRSYQYRGTVSELSAITDPQEGDIACISHGQNDGEFYIYKVFYGEVDNFYNWAPVAPYEAITALENKVYNNLTTDDLEGGAETWVFNCGTSSTVL